MRDLVRRGGVVGAVLLSVGVALLQTSCGDKKNGGGDPGGGGGSCTSTVQCTGGQVCDQSTNACASSSSVTCTAQAACGAAAYCNTTTGNCEASAYGAANPCASNGNCVDGETCTSGGYCGCDGAQLSVARVVPNVVIVLDRSLSMETDAKIDGQTKAAIAKAAINTVLANYATTIGFGLAIYSGTSPTACVSNNNCAAGGTVVAPVLGSVSSDALAAKKSTIESTLSDVVQCGHTPIGATLDALRSSASTWDTTRPNYVLLLTDGKENCGGSPADVATSLRNHSPPIKTYVVGFGSGVDGSQLRTIAVNGGTTDYYDASNAATLNAAFEAIAGAVASCNFALSSAPSSSIAFSVYQNGVLVSPDATNGWSFTNDAHTAIQLNGAACASLKSGTGDLSIVYGCGTVTAR